MIKHYIQRYHNDAGYKAFVDETLIVVVTMILFFLTLYLFKDN